ncbi:MAG TPA: 1-acyl-sn-glycerol-3-phosphate acyltransferase [Polyangiaceae bacterium]|nr:1-acyl-sn-glycerol-3-phosphate acyltransferase [Polyangiaceae bacterium]
MSDLARQLTQLSATEMVAALGATGAPALVRRGLALPFLAASRPLGQKLAELDTNIPERGLPEAARRALERFGVTLRVSGAALEDGPQLVLANHPGAYDALSLMTALGRTDLLILAADRSFLRALPRLSEHLCWVGVDAASRAGALRRAVSWLRAGGAVLHFPAGQIEPDADFVADAQQLLGPWQPGVKTLVRACLRHGGQLAVAGVRGVHSPRAKRLLINRWAEQRGITTLSALLQIVGGLRDVVTRVHRQPLRLVAAPESDSSIAELRQQLSAAILRASHGSTQRDGKGPPLK